MVTQRLAQVLAHVTGAVLRLAPRSFRAGFGPEIVWTLEQALKDVGQRRGNGPMLALWVRSFADMCSVARRERRASGHPRLVSAWRDLGGDLRFAVRSWRRATGFSLTIVLTLALGLGLAGAIFSFADGYLFRPLPFPDSDRAYLVLDPNADVASALKEADVVALRNSPLREYGFVEWSSGPLGRFVAVDREVSVLSYEVSEGFRDTLRLPLIAGRDFMAQDLREGAPRVAWLSHPFWIAAFGGDRRAVGQTIRLQGKLQDVLVVGILGPEVASFDLNNPLPQLVIPKQGPVVVGPNRLAFPIVVLPEGLSVEQATTQVASILQAAAPASDGRPRVVRLRPLAEDQVAGGAPTARIFLAGALLVMLLAAMNVVHLLLTRSVTRAHEVATRFALGASRWRIARLFLVESLTLGALGIALGVGMAAQLSRVIASNIPEFPTAGRNLALVPMLFDTRVIGFTLVIGLIASCVGGLWPAWRAWRSPLSNGQRSQGGSGGRTVSRRLSRFILASELSVATVVVLGTAFVGLGIYRYLNPELGFSYEDRLHVRVTGAAGKGFLDGTETSVSLQAVRAVSGVAAAGLEHGVGQENDIVVPESASDTKRTSAQKVTAGYFQAWGMHLRQGRWFTPEEFKTRGGVVVVDERFARLAWPDGNPLERSVKANGVVRQVIGVVQARREVLEREFPPVVYIPEREETGRALLIAWTPGADPEEMRVRLTTAVQTALPGSIVTVRPVTFEEMFYRGIGEAQFQAPVVTAFGVLAICLAGIGVFGLVSYLVEQRTREFGIRMALGADRASIWRSVMRESWLPALAGLGVGALGAMLLDTIVESAVFGWKSSGIEAMAAVSVLLLGIAFVAALGPARRATRVDPAVTLRLE